MENNHPLLLSASSLLNDLVPRIFPWARSGAIASVTVEPLAGSPDTPAWYFPDTGSAFVNLAVVCHGDEKAMERELRKLRTDPRRASTLLGLLAHEFAHSQWSEDIRPVLRDMEIKDPGVEQVATLFEELRIEKRAVDWKVDRHYLDAEFWPSNMLRGSFCWLLGEIARAGSFDTRPLGVAHTWALTFGRYPVGIATREEVSPIDNMARTVLGDDTVDTMRELLEEAIATESLPRVIRLSEEWLALLRTEDGENPPPSARTCSHTGEGRDDESGTGVGDGTGEDKEGPADDDGDGKDGDGDGEEAGNGGHGRSEVADLLEATVKEVQHTITETPTLLGTVTLSDPAELAARVFRKGKTFGSQWTIRKPDPDLRAEARRLSRTLEALSLPSVTLTKTPSTLPPGRLRGREAVRQSAERSMGLLSTATPWERSKRRRTTTKPVIVGVMTDTSGSMAWAQTLVADFAWILATAGQRVGARTAAVTFGNSAEMVLRPGEIPDDIRERAANGSEEAFDQAAAAIDGVLHLSTPMNAAKVLFVVSDGVLVIPGEPERARQWLERWTAGGTLVVWIGSASHYYEGVIFGGVRGPGRLVRVDASTIRDRAELLRKMESQVLAAARGMQ